MAIRLLPPFYQVVDANGRPVIGARLYTYESGTSTPMATYADAGLTIANTNPVPANAAGMFPDIFADESLEYHLVLKDRHDVTITDADPVGAKFGWSDLPADARATLQFQRARVIFAADNYAGFSGTATARTAAIHAAIADAAAAGGGEVQLPPGVWTIDATLEITSSRISIRGASRPAYNGTSAATRLVWAGAPGGTMIKIAPVPGPSAKSLFACEVHNLYLDGGVSGGTPIGGRGLDIRSHQFGLFTGLQFSHWSSAALYTSVVTELAFGENVDTQNNVFEGLVIQQHYAGCGFGIHLHGRLDETLARNSSFNQLYNIVMWHADATGFAFGNCDMNFVRNLRIWRTSGSLNSIVFGGAADATNVARYNLLEMVFAQGGVYSQGTEATNPAIYNEVRFLDTPNGTPAPNIGTNSLFNYSTALSFAHRGNTGAAVLEGNMLLQWGEETIAADTAAVVNLPFPFAAAAYSVTATYDYANASATDTAPGAQRIDASTIRVVNTASGARNIMWQAIGPRPNA